MLLKEGAEKGNDMNLSQLNRVLEPIGIRRKAIITLPGWCGCQPKRKGGKTLKRVTIKQAASATGLTVYALRCGVKAGRYPAIRIGNGQTRRKLLFDLDQLETVLQAEACGELPKVTVLSMPLRRNTQDIPRHLTGDYVS